MNMPSNVLYPGYAIHRTPSVSKRIEQHYAAHPDCAPTFDALCIAVGATQRQVTVALDTLRRYGRLRLESVRVVRVPARDRV